MVALWTVNRDFVLAGSERATAGVNYLIKKLDIPAYASTLRNRCSVLHQGLDKRDGSGAKLGCEPFLRICSSFASDRFIDAVF